MSKAKKVEQKLDNKNTTLSKSPMHEEKLKILQIKRYRTITNICYKRISMF